MSFASDLARLVTSGSTAIHGEAGVTSSGSTGKTTNLQQGLCKVWQDLNGETFGSRDSLNTSGNTDHGTGNHTNSFTNNMGSANYTFSSYCGDPNQQMGTVHIQAVSDKVAGSLKYVTNYVNNTGGGGAQLDCEHVLISIHGDLA